MIIQMNSKNIKENLLIQKNTEGPCGPSRKFPFIPIHPILNFPVFSGTFPLLFARCEFVEAEATDIQQSLQVFCENSPFKRDRMSDIVKLEDSHSIEFSGKHLQPYGEAQSSPESFQSSPNDFSLCTRDLFQRLQQHTEDSKLSLSFKSADILYRPKHNESLGILSSEEAGVTDSLYTEDPIVELLQDTTQDSAEDSAADDPSSCAISTRVFLNGITASKSKLTTLAKPAYLPADPHSPLLSKLTVFTEKLRPHTVESRQESMRVTPVTLWFSVPLSGFLAAPVLEFSNQHRQSRGLLTHGRSVLAELLPFTLLKDLSGTQVQ